MSRSPLAAIRRYWRAAVPSRALPSSPLFQRPTTYDPRQPETLPDEGHRGRIVPSCRILASHGHIPVHPPMSTGSPFHIVAASLLALLLLLIPVAWGFPAGEAGTAVGCMTAGCSGEPASPSATAEPAGAGSHDREGDTSGGTSECRVLCPCCFPQLPPVAVLPPAWGSTVAVCYPDLAAATIDLPPSAIDHPPC